MTRERAKRRGIELTRQLPPAQSLSFVADRRRVIQILINLLSNTIKFTENGGRVTTEVEWDPNGGYWIRISDTGIGIAAEDIPKIFERFGKLESSIAREVEGAGIGLSLTKSLVELHDGVIDVKSEQGIGTTVSIWLPAEKVAKRTCRPKPAQPEPVASVSSRRLGVIGVSDTSTPLPRSASLTALAIAAGGGIAPPSPSPLTPYSVNGDGVTR